MNVVADWDYEKNERQETKEAEKRIGRRGEREQTVMRTICTSRSLYTSREGVSPTDAD